MSDTVERTFTFVDLAGFTALTEAHGDRDAVVLLDRFLNLTRASLSDEDELVKSIGDAVMLASRSSIAALDALTLIWDHCSNEQDFPLPRAGAHHGPAIARDGDYLGTSVNLAARVAGHAAGGQVLVTSALVVPARQRGTDVVELGPYLLHNVIEPVQLFELRLGHGEATDTIDPVCRMRVDRELASGSLRHGDHRFWFCSMTCVAKFAAHPDRYDSPRGPSS